MSLFLNGLVSTARKQQRPRYRKRKGLRGAACAIVVGALLGGHAVLFPDALEAHIMSMSSGELRVEETQARYRLSMPLYEITHLEQPEETLLQSFQIYLGDLQIPSQQGSCREDPEAGTYLCESLYEFPQIPDELTIECRYAEVTVPNHIHLLRAVRGDLVKQAVFDFSLRRAAIRFTPASWQERATSQMWTGVVRVVTGPFQVLFLAALVLAGRQKRELVLLALAFVLSQSVTALVVPFANWSPPARFVEAAAALTVAYLAVEILLLPKAGHGWLIAGGMGVFHGLYFASFLAQSGMTPAYLLAGVLLADAFLLLLGAYLLVRIQRGAAWLRPIQSGAVLLFLIGIVWFVLRLRS